VAFNRTNIEQNLRRTEQEQSVILAREKYEVDKVLEIDDKVKELKKTHEWFFRQFPQSFCSQFLLIHHVH
jgi:hypothetical protein